MFTDYLSAVILIVFAEMGDKTQFLAMAFATKYPVKKILIGIALGSFLNHGLAMLLGRALMQLMPGEIISFIAGLMFIFFAFQSLKIDDEDIEEGVIKYGPILTVALAFFLGELGDKTQLAALGLSIDSTYIIVALLGTVSGMLITSGLGIYIGLKLGKNIPEDKLKISAFVIFIVFGVQKLYAAYLNQLEPLWVIAFVTIMTLVSFVTIKIFSKKFATIQQTTFMRQAERLKGTTEKIEFKIATMCKGTDHCGVCEGKNCLVGYMRYTLSHAEKPITEIETIEISRLKNKAFNKAEAKEIIHYLIIYFDLYETEFLLNTTLKSLRHTAEYIICEKMISTDVYEDYKREINKYI